MSLEGGRVYIHGRLRGLTKRRVGQLAVAAGITLTRKATSAATIVLGRSSAGRTLSDVGELALGFQPQATARFASEPFFKSALGISFDVRNEETPYSGEQFARHSGLTPAQVRALALYDILKPVDGQFSYTDLVVARSIAQMLSAGAHLGKIAAAAIALEGHGASLSGVRLSEAPWGEVLQEIGGQAAGLDGQFILPLLGDDISADEAFARAEASEAGGDMRAAQRWYELAARLDPGDAVIPFNLGNVLDAQGRSSEAVIAYRQSIARDPALADAWFNLGVLQEKQGRVDEALASYERAALVEPSYNDARHNAASLLMRLRRFEAALPLWDRIAAATPSEASEARRFAHLCRLEVKHASPRP
jgi:tetratricopeptide (TPR) repeat protein